MRTLNSAVPVATPEEAFAVNEKIRWMAFSTDKGDLVFCQMRPGVLSYSSSVEVVDFG